MNAILALVVAGLLLVVSAAAGLPGGAAVFGVAIPYAAGAVFLAGVAYRVLKWARAPVPFHTPTTCGQEKSMPWVKNSFLDNPHNALGVLGRMALEILFFRSLFRNTKSELREGGARLAYADSKWLWLGGIVFHWSFLVIVVRHLRFFLEPVPFFVHWAQFFDGFFQIGVPILYLTDLGILTAVTYLFLRRVAIPQLRYLSLTADYLPLFLILGIATTGILMRYFIKVDVIAVKKLALGLAGLNPSVPEGIGTIFYMHLFLACSLLAYFPFSKLMHMGGVFLSPTRNLANNSRMKRHVNPWNHDVKVHTYAEYEDEFRDVMKAAGLPLEKEG